MSLVARTPSQELADLVGTLGGRWHSQAAMCRCPAHADSTASLSLRQGDSGILVHCFAGCTTTEVLSALRQLTPKATYAIPQKGQSRGRANIHRLWDEAIPVEGTLAERYLVRRGLTKHLPDLRYHPRCPKGAAPNVRFLPALLVAIREGPEVRAVQRVFLDANTGEHTAKLTLGSLGAGGWQGARAGEELAIAEGFETAAAFHQLTGIPCWASLGGERLYRVAVPSQVKRLIIAEDNDAEGRRLAAKALSAHESRGLAVRRKPPPSAFGDWADALTGRGRGGGPTR